MVYVMRVIYEFSANDPEKELSNETCQRIPSQTFRPLTASVKAPCVTTSNHRDNFTPATIILQG